MSDQADTVKDSPKPVLVQPTLFIGVGGTGMEIALRVRRRILNHVWGSSGRISNLTKFPLAQFINFDLDAGSVIESGLAAATDPLSELVKFSEEEKLISKLEMEKYLRSEGELNRHKYIAPWFPLTPKKVRELGIDPSKGAGQIRALSRLYFFDKYLPLRSMIEGKINALLAGADSYTTAKTESLGLKLEGGSLRVVVIASTAGGTGSGSFLDMGYLSKWMADIRFAGNNKVDLCLMLPSGYSGHGKSRTEANTYAALMEMEACIGRGLKYVEGWSGENMDKFPTKPYDDIFLFDTGNLALKRTAKATDVFDMVADILFEDFTSEEFATRKRSTAVNQNKHKVGSFFPQVDPDKYGEMKLMYSKAYSAFGQSIIDTQLEQRRDEIACGQVNDMLKVFFGIASDTGGGREVPPPTPEDGRSLLKEEPVYCSKKNFKIAYHFVSDAAPYEMGIEFAMPKLVDHLLYDGDKPMIGQIHDRINRGIDEILASTEKDQRLPRVEKLRTELDRDLGIEGGATDAGARGLEESIKARRKYVFQGIVDENSRLLNALWTAVDDKEKGGLDYTIQLIERIKDCIENDATGLLRDMETAQKWFAGLCEKLRAGELQVIREHLSQTKGGKLFGFGGNKESHAEAKLQQMGEAIRWYAEARLREVSSREAAALLRDLSAWLGQHQGLDERTKRKIWSVDSFAGKLAGYEKLVIEIMSSMNEEVIRTREATKKAHAAYQVVKASTSELDAARNLDPKKAMEWAKEVFEKLKGSRAIFQMLEDDVTKAELIRKLRNLALRELPDLGRGKDNPLIQSLREMQEDERKRLFQRCLEMAMPWVEASLGGDWTVNHELYTCIVGLSGADIFRNEFGPEFSNENPARAGMNANNIEYKETGVPGKLTCYVELSGMPLTSLSLLSSWRDNYIDEDKKIPVHTHKDKALFVHPIAPSAATLDRLAEHFKLYLQGIVFGVLKPRVDSPKERRYCITISGEKLSIGDERDIRMDGVPLGHLSELQKKVAEALERIKSPAQHAALSVLYDYYAKNVYPPKIKEGKSEEFEKGFCHVMCTSLKEEAEKKMKKKAADMDTTDLIARLKGEDNNDEWVNFSSINIWTEEIDGSETDAYEDEIGSNHRAKRILKRDFFQAGWLEKRFKLCDEEQEEPLKRGDGSRSTSCSSCGERVDGNPRFCPHCGNQMKFEKKCPGCGCAIEGNPKFCPECGAKQGGAQQCGNCGCAIEGSPKFCPECGKPV